ncbi:MAG TPA: hypothetical protein VKC89_01060 [Patescibacteria group bacterium]|nr:hypothetical protein [Patescibacteria group bacterium]
MKVNTQVNILTRSMGTNPNIVINPNILTKNILTNPNMVHSYHHQPRLRLPLLFAILTALAEVGVIRVDAQQLADKQVIRQRALLREYVLGKIRLVMPTPLAIMATPKQSKLVTQPAPDTILSSLAT